MSISSPLWMRVTWVGMLLAAFYMPLYFLGIEIKGSENCAPDIPWSDYEAVRRLAKWTWAGSLVSVGVLLGLALRYAPSRLPAKPVLAAFILWKALTLALSFITSPSCFESYGTEGAYNHPLEATFTFAGIFAWALLLILIFVGFVMGPRHPND